MTKSQQRRSNQGFRGKLELDQALIALFIGAMNANDHVSPEEAARAHHLIWSTRRFRRKSGETVGKLIDDVRALLEERDPTAVMDVAAKAIPGHLRQSAFAVLVDVVLVDGKMDTQERKFLQRIGAELKMDRDTVHHIVEIIRLKNQL